MEDIISIVRFILHLLWSQFADPIWRVLGCYFTGFIVVLQHLNVWRVMCGSFILVVPIQLAPEARNVLEQNTVAARNGGAQLNECHLDLLIVIR